MSNAIVTEVKEAPEVLKKPTPKQDRFCKEYIVDLNQRQAAIRASYSPRTASEIAYELLRKPHIQARIAGLALIREQKSEKSAQDVIKELENIGFSRLGDIIEWNQSGMAFLKDSDELSDDAMAAIESVQVTEEQAGDDKNSRMVLKSKVKLHSKMAALTQLAKHHGLVGDMEARGDVNIQVNVVNYADSKGQDNDG